MSERDLFAPDALQVQLLLALLAEPERARPAAQAWLEGVAFDALDEGTRRLMPMLHSRLAVMHVAHPLVPRIRGLYRQAWYLDSARRQHMQGVLAALAGLNTPLVVLKGVALGQYAYDTPVHRPFVDMDVLVHPDAFDAVVGRMRAMGYTLRREMFHAICAMPPARGDGLRAPGVMELDLHRSPYAEVFGRGHVLPLLDRVVPVPGMAAGVAMLGAEDQLLHTLSHGLRPNAVMPVRWMVDAVQLLRVQPGSIDWTLFADEAARLDQAAVARMALDVVAGLDVVRMRAPFNSLPAVRPEARARVVRERTARGARLIWQLTRRNGGLWRRVGLIVGLLRDRVAADGWGAVLRAAWRGGASHPG
ncbi:hypothetical protein GTZ99_15290 [Novosphingobium sp. FSY-8]|uniref:Nucleotidyltransferase-like protein n=1 Tax=Novosphingobium ovatum TaxID=1908523 RepID=A0ABW9XH96_9SPHN|nr:nucleotidyltransferase family protein [Novosphingobium ovatum]NBC37918.1 hypothetical protein [Novosphingobium ovatum]